MPENQISIRLKKFIDFRNLSGKEIEDLTGYSAHNIWQFTSGRTSNPRIDLIKAFADHFPELNLHWLFTGEGEMFIPGKTAMKDLLASGKVEATGTVSEKFMEYEKEINELKEFIRGKFPDFNG